MAQRILTLTFYLFRGLLFSLPAILYFLAALVLWRVFFDPTQRTPELSYYTLVIGLFGAGITFLVTLSVAGRAHLAANYPLLARLPSRVEHLVAVLGASLLFALVVQLFLALLGLFRGPSLATIRVLEIPPLWLAVDILAAVLALHASDLVTAGWSRVYLFSLLALFLFGRSLEGGPAGWIAQGAMTLGQWFLGRNLIAVSDLFNALGRWLSSSGSAVLDQLFGIPFWPFQAMTEAIRSGSFSSSQALAPAILLLYATILFVLAADLFAGKDLFFTE
jgi:hypothetical protein